MSQWGQTAAGNLLNPSLLRVKGPFSIRISHPMDTVAFGPKKGCELWQTEWRQSRGFKGCSPSWLLLSQIGKESTVGSKQGKLKSRQRRQNRHKQKNISILWASLRKRIEKDRSGGPGIPLNRFSDPPSWDQRIVSFSSLFFFFSIFFCFILRFLCRQVLSFKEKNKKFI